MSAQVTITATALPNILWEGDLQSLLELFASHLEGTFNDNVITGQVGGSSPLSNVGVWQNGNAFYMWNEEQGRYMPSPLVLGRVYTNDTMNLTKILSAAQADRTIYTPDKDGVFALTSDIHGESPTATLGGTTASLDWSIEAKNHYLVLSGNTTLSHTNAEDGQERHLFVENPLNQTYTISFSGVTWVNGDPSAQTAGTATHGGVNEYIFRKIGAFIFGEQTQYWMVERSGGSADVVAPVIQLKQHSGSGNVCLVYNEILRGGDISTSEFEVRKNGVVQTLSSATASNNQVVIDTNTTFTSGDTVTVKYNATGSPIKDLVGNSALNFTQSNSTYVSHNPPPPGHWSGDQNEP